MSAYFPQPTSRSVQVREYLGWYAKGARADGSLAASELGAIPTEFSSGGIDDGAVASADPWAADLVELVFAQAMRSDEALADSASYLVSLATGGSGVAVSISDVLVPDGATVTSVFLVVSPFTIGTEYTIAASGNALRTATGQALRGDENTASFFGRTTKIDMMMRSFPRIYDLSPRSRLRRLVNAFGRPIDLAFGSRRDRLP